MNSTLAKRHEDNLLLSVETLAEYFNDDSVTDIYINPDCKLFIKQFSKPRSFTGRIIEPDTTKRIINFTASMSGKIINEKQPVLSAVMPYYELRVHAIIPPWVSAPSICIRKINKTVIPLTRFVSEDRLTDSQYRFLMQSIKARKNIIIAGGTGSGKTTFLNALIHAISKIHPKHRLYIVEDTGEVLCSAEDFITVCVEPEQTVNAVRSALRYYPDRILFGELRYGDTTNELIKSWKTGHPGGLATIHAESAGFVLSRIRDLIHESIKGRITYRMLAETIDICVFLQDSGQNGPKITDLMSIGINRDTKKIIYKSIT